MFVRFMFHTFLQNIIVQISLVRFQSVAISSRPLHVPTKIAQQPCMYLHTSK